MKVKHILIAAAAILLAAALVVGCLIFYDRVKTRQVMVNPWFISERDTLGVDISEYQADVDMDALCAQGVRFAYIRATEGSSGTDERFYVNWESAGKSGLIRGAYHFFSFDSPGETQARNYIETVGDLSGCLIPAIDVEYYGDKEQDPPQREDVVRELGVLLRLLEEEYGVKPMIYASGRLYETCIKGAFDEYPRWVRSVFYPVLFEAGGNWLVWQYSDRGELDGYSGGERFIDLNAVNRKYGLESLIIP